MSSKDINVLLCKYMNWKWMQFNDNVDYDIFIKIECKKKMMWHTFSQNISATFNLKTFVLSHKRIYVIEIQ